MNFMYLKCWKLDYKQKAHPWALESLTTAKFTFLVNLYTTKNSQIDTIFKSF